jgi:hypothetical protein
MSVFPVFTSNLISFTVKDDDYHYVLATQDIKQGTLLLVEHCYSAPSYNKLATVIKTTPLLFNELCPRTVKWNPSIPGDSSEQIVSLCKEKTQHNAFGHDGMHLIGVHATKFNHSDEPNATVKIVRCRIREMDVSCDFIYIYANKDIMAGQEVCTWYGNQFFGNGASFIDSFDLDRSYNQIARDYLNTSTCKNIVVEHLCIHHGLYIIEDTFFITPLFTEFFTRDVKREPTVENIKQWILEQIAKLDVLLGVSK